MAVKYILVGKGQWPKAEIAEKSIKEETLKKFDQIINLKTLVC